MECEESNKKYNISNMKSRGSGKRRMKIIDRRELQSCLYGAKKRVRDKCVKVTGSRTHIYCVKRVQLSFSGFHNLWIKFSSSISNSLKVRMKIYFENGKKLSLTAVFLKLLLLELGFFSAWFCRIFKGILVFWTVKRIF